MSYQRQSDGAGWVWLVLGAIGMWLLFILGALWIASYYLTKLFLRHILSPILGGILERPDHDGLVVLISAGIWALIAAVMFPFVTDLQWVAQHQLEAWQTFSGMVGFGVLWGLSIGFWIVLTWWVEAEEREQQMRPSDYTQVLNLPPDLYTPTDIQPDTVDHTRSIEEMEAAFAEAMRAEEPQLVVENGPEKASVGQ
jgi:hypothetical protein